MPRETRKLLFDCQELETAAMDHCRRHGITVPEGALSALSVGTDPAMAVRLRFGVGEGAGELHLSQRQIGDALIDYCQESGIPIPRGALKSVRAEAGAIAIMIEAGIEHRAA